MIKVSTYGNGLNFGNKLAQVAKSMDMAIEAANKELAAFAEKEAVKHIQNQDLNWAPLSQKYALRKLGGSGASSSLKTRRRNKLKNGKRLLSDKILVSTGSYMNAITSYGTRNKAMAGILKGKTAPNVGKMTIGTYARVLEFGSKSRNIPARPLWRPVLKATIAYAQKNKTYLKRISQLYKK